MDRKVSKASKKRALKISNLTTTLRDGIDSGQVMKNAKKRFGTLHKVLDRENLKSGELLSDRLDRFESHLDRVKVKLDNDQWTRRASSAYVSAVMPEIWDDPAASSEFFDSFFEYVEFTNASRSCPLVVKSLRKACGFKIGSSSTDIEAAMKQMFSDGGWSSSFWLQK